MVAVFLGLGSNIHPRLTYLQSGLALLDQHPEIEVRRSSPVYECSPVGAEHADWYLNQVAEIHTVLKLHDLLPLTQGVEERCGRDVADKGRQLPRTLDIDILLYGESIVEEKGLAVPHPRLVDRAFVLRPLCDLIPHGIHPLIGRTFADLLACGEFDGQIVKPAERPADS